LIQAEDDLRDNSTTRTWRSHDILHAKVGKITNEWTGSPGVGQRVAPENPLKRSHSSDHKTLEQHSKRGLATRETAIEQTKTRNNQPDDEAAEHQVCVLELEPGVLGIDVDGEDITTASLRLVEDRL
jgi:hypothetical protein